VAGENGLKNGPIENGSIQWSRAASVSWLGWVGNLRFLQVNHTLTTALIN
jgi:hypothetical protein